MCSTSSTLAVMTGPKTEFTRLDGRAFDEMRPVRITRGFTTNPAGSVLVEFGATRVMCTASVEVGVPRFKKDSGEGWLTAEYAMLPSATHERMARESMKGKVKGRTHEISRLVGRSLRAAVDLAQLGENTIQLDCDVLQADGGTRTASITGAWVAMASALNYLRDEGVLKADPILDQVAAVSCGVCDGVPVLDLDYEEDSEAEADSNFVLTGAGQIVEVQATGEKRGFSRAEFDRLFELAEDLGYHSAWVRQRHLERGVSSAATFLAAATQRTSRIGLGSAVIQLGYESPFRLAEDLATLRGKLGLG